MLLESLLRKRVLVSMSQWDVVKGSLMPFAYTATLAAVDGAMILLAGVRTVPNNEIVPHTWVNMNSHVLNFIQEEK